MARRPAGVPGLEVSLRTARVRWAAINRAQTHIREWSSIPVNALALVPSARANPPTMSICHNSIGAPRSQRFHLRERDPAHSDQSSRPAPTPDRPPTPTALAAPGVWPARPPAAASPNTAAPDATPTTRPPPPPASDADTTPADATALKALRLIAGRPGVHALP